MRYIALFKPYGVLSSFTHEQPADAKPKRTLSEFALPPNVYAAGRLDFDSEGLLLLSDDGHFIHRVTDPRHKQPKTYCALVEGVPTPAALAQLRRGVVIKGYRTQPCQVEALHTPPDLPPREKPITPHGPTAWLAITLHEAAHGYAARALGDDTAERLGRISLNPLRHVDPVGTLLVPLMMAVAQLLAAGQVLGVFGWAKPVPVDIMRLAHPRRDMMLVAAAGSAMPCCCWKAACRRRSPRPPSASSA